MVMLMGRRRWTLEYLKAKPCCEREREKEQMLQSKVLTSQAGWWLLTQRTHSRKQSRFLSSWHINEQTHWMTSDNVSRKGNKKRMLRQSVPVARTAKGEAKNQNAK
jgi:hypothetical protein